MNERAHLYLIIILFIFFTFKRGKNQKQTTKYVICIELTDVSCNSEPLMEKEIGTVLCISLIISPRCFPLFDIFRQSDVFDFEEIVGRNQEMPTQCKKSLSVRF